MDITLIGAGNLATNLGKALLKAGHNIVQVYSRTEESATTLARILDAEPVCSISDVDDTASVYIIAVKDSALASLLPSLCMNRGDKIFLHTAGSMNINVFDGMARNYGVFYPMQTFSKEREVDFSVIPCFIEGSDDAVSSVAKELAHTVSDHVYDLSSDGRRVLHLAAVFASNFVNHCFSISSELLSGCGIPFDVMYPLIDEVVAKARLMRPVEAQTGPAVRYDVNVISRQAEMLSSEPLLRDIYEDMSRSIHEMSERQRKDTMQ